MKVASLRARCGSPLTKAAEGSSRRLCFFHGCALRDDDNINDLKGIRIDDGDTIVVQHDVGIATIVRNDQHDVFRNRIEVH